MGDDMMGGFSLENLFFLFQAIQPFLNIASAVIGQGLQFLFLILDFGTFFLGFI